VVVTGSHEGGGWRVPGVEYDMTPERVELQAKIIAASPKFIVLLKRLVDVAKANPENLPDDVMEIAGEAQALLANALAADFN
jgi:hypothetical protein